MGRISKWFGGHNTVKAQGERAEALACRYLQKQGLKLLQRNFSWRWGEIDLIMKDVQTLVFVEVRYRSRNDYGRSFESVTLAKQRRIIKTAAYYLQKKPQSWYDQIRFDVLGVESLTEGQEHINWLSNAFDLTTYEQQF